MTEYIELPPEAVDKFLFAKVIADASELVEDKPEPIDRAFFERTAPAFNCISDPDNGPHYIGTRDGSCGWCGMTNEEITEQRHQQTLAWQREQEG